MDLSKFNMEIYAEKGAVMELVNPVDGETLLDDEGNPVSIKLLGQDSKAWRKMNRDFTRKKTSEMAKSRRRSVDFTMTDEEKAEMVAACTIGWSGIEEDGQAIEFSQESAKDIYMKYSWIREQADEFIGDRANFFTVS